MPVVRAKCAKAVLIDSSSEGVCANEMQWEVEMPIVQDRSQGGERTGAK